MPFRNIIVPLLLIASSLGLPACSPQQPTQTPTATLTPPALTPYRTPTLTLTPSGPPPTLTPLPTATLTPVTYAVKQDDDMFGIALRFGVSLPALKTANPTVNPYFLGVGMVLVIPVTPTPPGAGTETPQVLTSTPGPVRLSPPTCYPSAEGGLWCLAEAQNNQSAGVEALGVKFRLSDPSSGEILEQTVFAPLNVLPGNGRLPVMAYFKVQGTRGTGVEAVVENSLPLVDEETRYPAVEIEDQHDQIEGNTAQVTGKVKLIAAGAQASEAWVLAAAYGSDDVLVGLRRWEAPGGLKSGEAQAFTINIYSLGPQIARVALFAEAHATQPGSQATLTP